MLISRRVVRDIRTPCLRVMPRAVVAILSLVLCITTLAAAQDEKPKIPPTGAPGARVLFDGKSLDGWKKCDFYKAGEVKVEDGMIVMSKGVPMSGITTTHQNLPTTNYELRYEAMRLEGQDFFAAATFPVGKSFITLVNGGWGGGVTGLSSLDGMDASENDTTRSVRYKDKTWYHFRVRVTAKMIRCLIDDKEIIAVAHGERRVATRIETRRNQPLGFAAYDCTGALRQIEIRPLTAAEIAEVDKFEE